MKVGGLEMTIKQYLAQLWKAIFYPNFIKNEIDKIAQDFKDKLEFIRIEHEDNMYSHGVVRDYRLEVLQIPMFQGVYGAEWVKPPQQPNIRYNTLEKKVKQLRYYVENHQHTFEEWQSQIAWELARKLVEEGYIVSKFDGNNIEFYINAF